MTTNWMPLYYTRPLTEDFRTRGDKYIEFAETFLSPLRGKGAGKPLVLCEWQKWLLRAMFEEKEDGTLRYRRVTIGLPRKNGKSFLASIIQLYNALHSEPGDELYVAARNRRQAEIVFNGTLRMAQSIDGIGDYLKFTPSERTITNKYTGVEFRALTADGEGAQGLAPYISIADELHTWDTPRGKMMWSALKDGSGDRDEAMVIAISTAGSSTESTLGLLHKEGVSLSEIEDYTDVPSSSIGFFWWGAKPGEDPGDREQWIRANPMVAEGLYSMDELETEWASAEEKEELTDFLRYHLNVFAGNTGTRGEQPWIPDAHFVDSLITNSGNAGYNSPDDEAIIPEGSRIVLGFDGSRTNDSTAIVGIGMEALRKNVMGESVHPANLMGIWEKTGADSKWQVPVDEVMDTMDDIFSRYEVIALYCDTSYWMSEVQEWTRKYGRRVYQLTQNRRMGEASAAAETYILNGRIALPNSRRTDKLKSHIMSAVRRGKTISKSSEKSRDKVDAAIAYSLAAIALHRNEGHLRRIEQNKNRIRPVY